MELSEIKTMTERGEKEFEKTEGETIDSTQLPPFVWIPDFISLAGSTMYERHGREPGDVDMIVRAEEDGDGGFKVELDAGLRLKVDRIMEDLLGCGSTSWTAALTGPNWRYKPLWDLALVPHEPDEIREINEEEFAEEFYKVHPLEQCMECEAAPEFEILWAEGRAHAWFCRRHTLEFIKEKVAEKLQEENQKVDIVWIKACEGKAHKNPTENQNDNVQEALTEEIEKLNLEQFRQEGIDEDLKNPKRRWRQLQADLRYLGNVGYPRLKAGKEWGEWTLEDIYRYFAKIVDALRSIYFPVTPPKIGEEGFSSSYWKCYQEASKYMKTKPPKTDEAKLWNLKREEILRKFEKFVKIFDVSKSEDEHIVCGIVYSPDEDDAQGDQASAEEIRKAAYDFMEKVQRFGTNHVSDSIKWAFGKNPLARVLENYIAPCDLTIEGEPVKKGSWVLITRILSETLWSKIKSGEITGYSMAGKATA